MQLLKGKKAIITGGTSGIGKEIAMRFVQEGASVAVFGTSEEKANQALFDFEQRRTDDAQHFFAQAVDVSDKKSMEETIQHLIKEWGSIDILVNNAGITRDNLLMKMSEEDWDAVIDTNLKSVYNACQALVRMMIKARGGSIINIASVVGLTGNAGQVNYAASKAGMIGFTKALAQELAARNVCVNCIAPGFIKTRMTDVLTDAQKQVILNKIPMGRMGNPEDIADAAVFLASDLSRYITGQVLTVDGGMVM